MKPERPEATAIGIIARWKLENNGQWSVASPFELFDWQVSYLDIYLFYVYSVNLVWYCQSTKAKVTLWSVDLIEGLNCWNML